MCVFAYVAALIVYRIGLLLTGVFSIWTVAAILVLALMLYLLLRKNPYREDAQAVKTPGVGASRGRRE